jgi:hypothetical protein
VPNLPIYVNIARVFYEIGLNGTIIGVVLVHAAHGLVLAVWIASRLSPRSTRRSTKPRAISAPRRGCAFARSRCRWRRPD